MSEELNPRELPHQVLMRRYGLSMEQMSNHTKQLKSDLDKTLRLVLNRSKEGAIKLTPITQSKIETYDRYICDGVFEYLEKQDNISEGEVEKVEQQMDDKREDVKEKMEEIHEEATSTSDNDTSTEEKPSSESEEEKPQEDSGSAKIGFWDWK